MDFASVLQQILEEFGWLQFIGTVTAVVSVYFMLFRRRVQSLFDPLTYVLVLSSATTILLLILHSFDVVTGNKLLFAVTVLLLYYSAFLLVSVRRVRLPPRPLPPQPLNAAMLAFLFTVNGSVLAATYVFFGIPLFLEARLSQFAAGGGIGAISRLAGGLEFICVLLGFIATKGSRGSVRAWGYALIVQFVIAAILSGSKGSVLGAVFAWYLSHVYFARSWRIPVPLSRVGMAVLLLILALPLITISVQTGGNAASLGTAAALYATRFAAEGDGYVYFFGGDLIDSIARTDYLALIRPILTALRLAPVETAVNPGFEVMREIIGIDSLTAGPNSRLPIYLLYFYGTPGLMLAPVLGAALGVARNALLRATGRSAVRYALLASIYLSCTRFEVDPQIAMNAFFNLLLVLPIVWLAWTLGHGAARQGRGRSVPGATRLQGAS